MRPETYESILDIIRATPDTPKENIAECGECHFRWDDTIPTELTPAPSARCPNEYHHVYDDTRPTTQQLFNAMCNAADDYEDGIVDGDELHSAVLDYTDRIKCGG